MLIASVLPLLLLPLWVVAAVVAVESALAAIVVPARWTSPLVGTSVGKGIRAMREEWEEDGRGGFKRYGRLASCGAEDQQ